MHRDIFLKWVDSQQKIKPEELSKKLQEAGNGLERLLDKEFTGDVEALLEGQSDDKFFEIVCQLRDILINFD